MMISTYFFFFNDTATTEIYTLSLHDALPIFADGAGDVEQVGRAPAPAVDERERVLGRDPDRAVEGALAEAGPLDEPRRRSEEHTSELQSRQYLVCRLLLEKKKKNCIALFLCT